MVLCLTSCKILPHIIVTGGDACVPPNLLACEAADMLVQLAVGHGHLNSILSCMQRLGSIDSDWVAEVQAAKHLLSVIYNARGRSENYFQWVLTVICNLYSLPSMVS